MLACGLGANEDHMRDTAAGVIAVEVRPEATLRKRLQMANDYCFADDAPEPGLDMTFTLSG